MHPRHGLDLQFVQSVLTAPVVQLEKHRRAAIGQRHVFADDLLLLGTVLLRHFDGYFARRRRAPNPFDNQPILAAEAFGTDIVLGIAFRRLNARFGERVANHDTATGRPRAIDGTNGARRLFDLDVDIGIARPRDTDDTIPHHRGFGGLAKPVRFLPAVGRQ